MPWSKRGIGLKVLKLLVLGLYSALIFAHPGENSKPQRVDCGKFLEGVNVILDHRNLTPKGPFNRAGILALLDNFFKRPLEKEAFQNLIRLYSNEHGFHPREFFQAFWVQKNRQVGYLSQDFLKRIYANIVETREALIGRTPSIYPLGIEGIALSDAEEIIQFASVLKTWLIHNSLAPSPEQTDRDARAGVTITTLASVLGIPLTLLTSYLLGDSTGEASQVATAVGVTSTFVAFMYGFIKTCWAHQRESMEIIPFLDRLMSPQKWFPNERTWVTFDVMNVSLPVSIDMGFAVDAEGYPHFLLVKREKELYLGIPRAPRLVFHP